MVGGKNCQTQQDATFTDLLSPPREDLESDFCFASMKHRNASIAPFFMAPIESVWK